MSSSNNDISNLVSEINSIDSQIADIEKLKGPLFIRGIKLARELEKLTPIWDYDQLDACRDEICMMLQAEKIGFTSSLEVHNKCFPILHVAVPNEDVHIIDKILKFGIPSFQLKFTTQVV